MRLYEHPVSGNSHKIRLLMSFLGLEYESGLVDLLSDAQHKESFLIGIFTCDPSPTGGDWQGREHIQEGTFLE